MADYREVLKVGPPFLVLGETLKHSDFQSAIPVEMDDFQRAKAVRELRKEAS